MMVYRICQADFAEDFSGRGAFLYGGRWNSPGKYMLYTASSRALALLELLVHVPLDVIRFKDYKILSFQLPPESIIEEVEGYENVRLIGNSFLEKNEQLVLQVPSVIIPEEFNYLINPLHPTFHKIELMDTRPLKVDPRFI